MPAAYSTKQEIDLQAITPCKYCLEGKCAERKVEGLCHCGNHAEIPANLEETSSIRTSKESELVIEN